MNRSIYYWGIWVIALICINLGGIPIALFSLFGTPSGTSIFSLDYFIAFSIFLLSNIPVIQLFFALWKKDQKSFVCGLIFAIIEVCSFILFVNSVNFQISLILAIIGVLGAAVLLIKSFIR